MGKEATIIVSTQLRLGEDLYEYVTTESKRLGISMNAVLNTMLDECRRYRAAKITVQLEVE